MAFTAPSAWQTSPVHQAPVSLAGLDRAMRHLADLTRLLALVPVEPVGRAINLLLEAREKGQRVYVMGNGGSSATASHFVCDLLKTARVAGFEPLRAFGLTDNTPLLTAWANDHSYESALAEQISALAEPGDVVIGISASGRSPNIIQAFRAARARFAWTVALVGFDGGTARDMVDVAIHVPSDDYGLVEDAHAALAHAMSAGIREALDREASLLRSAAPPAPELIAGRIGS